MIQTRLLRIDLSKFELSSENRRILKKNESLQFAVRSLPLEDYSWEIHKLGKDFYSKKFGDGTMSAAKIKEMFQEPEKSNMNMVLVYNMQCAVRSDTANCALQTVNYVGYCLAYANMEMIHYAYPFYDLEIDKGMNHGMGMMIKAILWAKESGRKYIYLGSVVDLKSKYKLQFSGLEWWDNENKKWSQDILKLKELIS